MMHPSSIVDGRNDMFPMSMIPMNRCTMCTRTTKFMVFNVTYIVCKGPKLDANRSQSVTYANCKYHTIHQNK